MPGKKTAQQPISELKDPVLAVILSALFPGFGQVYTRQTAKALIIVPVALLAALVAVFSVVVSLQRPTPTGIILTVFFVALYLAIVIYSIRDAYMAAKRINESVKVERAEKGKKVKNPIIAAVLSIIFPGLGQIYNERMYKGLLLAGLIIVLAALSDLLPVRAYGFLPGFVIGLAILLIWLYALYDAVTTANRMKQGEIR